MEHKKGRRDRRRPRCNILLELTRRPATGVFQLSLENCLRHGAEAHAPSDAVASDVFRTRIFLLVHLLYAQNQTVDTFIEELVNRHDPAKSPFGQQLELINGRISMS